VSASLSLAIADELRGRVRLGFAAISGATVRAESDVLAREIEAYGAELRGTYGGGRSAEVPGAEDARSLYKAVGLDPTKTRPSNEALLRRVLKGEALYRVNTLVDALNLASLRHQLPFGLYDAARLRPPIVLRRGAAGEGYEGIRKARVNVDDRPVLVDEDGPFGNPTSDSARSAITLETREALVVCYAPAAITSARLARVVDETAALLVRHCSGAVTAQGLVPA
jgi:DNA/RNA-binding domain of Phe-tRNA-synthetase-like protein